VVRTGKLKFSKFFQIIIGPVLDKGPVVFVLYRNIEKMTAGGKDLTPAKRAIVIFHPDFFTAVLTPGHGNTF
jgi:hypothetical protein